LAAKKTDKAPPLAAFISYAKPDFEQAQEIAEKLEEHGFKCWIAPRDVRPGRAYGDEIIRGIERAQAFILVLSSASNGSGFVSREIERAVSKNKHIFTVRLEDVQPAPALELFVSSTQWIDAFKGRLGPHIDRLAQQLAEDEDVTTPGSGVAVPAPRAAEARPLWRSPFVLAGVAAAAIGIGSLLAFLFLRAPDTGDASVLAKSCRNLTGDGALAACDRAIAAGKFKGEELASLYGLRGYRKQEKYDIEGALTDYREALRLNPNTAWIYNARGVLYRDAREYDRGLADFDAAIALEEWADPYTSRGWIYSQQGKLEDARKDFEKALTLKPGPELKDKLHAALEAMDRADPDFKACDTESGQTAIAACDRAIATGNFSGRSLSILYNDRGYLRMMEGSLDEALVDLNEAIRIDPYSTYAHWNRAEVYRHKGELTSARADYERALSLGPRAQDKPKIEAALATIGSAPESEAGAQGAQ
jgi:Tfp pilus assembly protein PilF